MFTLEKAENRLTDCEYCSNSDCCECPNYIEMLDALMTLKAYEDEITAQEDAENATVEYLLSIA